jgi:L-cysteine S-thiosulfotransferase
MKVGRWRAACTAGAITVLLAACTVAPIQENQTTSPQKVRDTRRSGFAFMRDETRAMQSNDADNPGMLWVAEGADAWARPEGRAQISCAQCHSDATQSMRGVATRYPAFDTRRNGPISLAARINQCRSERQQAAPHAAESAALLNLETFVAHQSRGMPVAAPADPRLAPARERGRTRYAQKIGQLDLSCAQCHDEQAGRRLAGNAIPEAHPTGYPIYRLEWQSVGSLHRRLRNCMTGVRAEPFALGSPELTEIELYLMWRANGMPLESPAVRP